MKKDRKIEILNKIIETLETPYVPLYGICGALSYLYDTEIINYNEFNFIKLFIYDNKPQMDNKYKEFRKSKIWFNKFLDGYWWHENLPDSVPIRVAYLKALISNIK